MAGAAPQAAAASDGALNGARAAYEIPGPASQEVRRTRALQAFLPSSVDTDLRQLQNSTSSKPQSLAGSYRQTSGGRSRMPLSNVTPNRRGTGEHGRGDELTQQEGDLSRRGSESDRKLELHSRNTSNANIGARILDNDIPENMWRPEEDDPEGWIHRDKLAKIESEELQAAGIGLATRRQYGRSGRRGNSRDRRVDDVFERREEKKPRLAESALTEEEGERMNWDLRSPEEIAAEPSNVAQIGSPSALRKASSRIPVLTSSPHPIPPERLERDTPLPRKRTISNSMSADEAIWMEKKHTRKSSSASQTVLDAAEECPTPAGESSAGTSGSSPSRKVTAIAARKTSLPGQKNGPSQNAALPSQRSQTKGQDVERPRTAVNRPEGDPPWLATMYKPDPRLPPDQQIIPTHARIQQAAQWEADGAVPKTYDRNFLPLAVHDAEALARPTAIPSSPTEGLEPRTAQPAGWPLKPPANTKNTNDSRPGTSASMVGGYSTMPKVINVPAHRASNVSGSGPNAPVRLREHAIQGRGGEKDQDDGMVKKGSYILRAPTTISAQPSTYRYYATHLLRHNPHFNTVKLSFLNPIRSSIRSFFSAPTISAAAMSAAKQKAQKIIDENGVVVFSKSYCPHCRATKSLLNEKHAKYYLLELDEEAVIINADDGSDIQDALEEITGQRSVPNIFIGQKHIGGNSDLQSKRGELDGLLKSAGAI
ncbi:hypothetical protein DV736_g1353, partial [Chaetothyriales sp. CBS 134916]